MDSSDEEAEGFQNPVSNYHFVEDDGPISFSELPVQWNESERPVSKKEIFLKGATDNGLQMIYKQVTAWKFDLSCPKPEISVLTKENHWIKLMRPRKSYEEIIRTILITVQCLHFAKNNPDSSEKALWEHLSRIFRLYEPRPSVKDLADHMDLIREAMKKDEALGNAKVLVFLLDEKPRKRKAPDEDMAKTNTSSFIVEDVIYEEEESGSDEEEDCFDTVCAICDNGGELLCCEGRCLRSFHATVETGLESMCDSLGLTDDQVEAMQNFFCKNCQHQQHQCFVCGKLGSSDRSSGPEVFQCVSGNCGRFYHPDCVAKLLHRQNEAEAEKLQKEIAAGKRFACPAHYCYSCKLGEDKEDHDLQFAVCRRCPRSYHRKCLPRKIAFEDNEDEGIIQRAWEGLIPHRVLIYCLKHEIDDELATPTRNHIKFPYVMEKKKKPVSELPAKEKLVPDGGPSSGDVKRKGIVARTLKVVKRESPARKQDGSPKEERIHTQVPLKKQKVLKGSTKILKKSATANLKKPATAQGKPSLGDQLYALMVRNSEPMDSEKGESEQKTKETKPIAKEASSSFILDDDSKRRLLAMVKEASSSITLEKVVKKCKVPTAHAYSSKSVVDKTMTLGKVEASVEALRAALQKLEEGGTIEDAKAVCEPGLINQILKWKNKFKVYLAPFLYGMRYTSFGRHFTKEDKLIEIVNMLHWYVQGGDTIVDFCCGANDFSCLMKNKLDEMGKSCSYKNYDIFQAKNDFNFEKRDWMSVHPSELPPGSQLIMGLNPPFGVNAALANKFIDKALEFKPKLLILIVPRETERLDKKKRYPPYDLVWEHDKFLIGKSFYLPGSVDINDKQMEDWNVSTPPLYLWSRPDWTARHKAIAQEQGHLSKLLEKSQLEDNRDDRQVTDDIMMVSGSNVQDNVQNQIHEQGSVVEECVRGSHHRNNGSRGLPDKYHANQSDKKAPEMAHGKSKLKIGPDETLIGDKSAAQEVHRHGKSELRKGPDETLIGDTSAAQEVHQHVEMKNMYRSHSQLDAGYGINQDEDIARSYGMESEVPHFGLRDRWSDPDSHYDRLKFSDMQTDLQHPPNAHYLNYFNGMDAAFTRHAGVRPETRFGQQDAEYLSQRDNSLDSFRPGFSSSYRQLGRADLAYGGMSTSSALQRYAPRLDELNPSMGGGMGSDLQFSAPRLDELNPSRAMGSDYNLPAPGLGYRNNPNPPAPRPRYNPHSLGFASGPYRPFSQQNTSGWIDE